MTNNKFMPLNIQKFSDDIEAGTTIQINGSATLTDVDTSKESRVLRLLGQTNQNGTPTPTSPIPINVVSGDNEINICGKNLFQNEYIGTPTSAPNAILKAGTYTIATCDGNNFVTNVYFRLLDMNNNLVNENGHLTSTNTQINFSTSSNYYLGGSGNSYITFTIDNDYKIGIGLLNADGTRQVMLVKGSEAVRTYEPYQSKSYPIYLGVENLLKIKNTVDRGLTTRVNEDGSISVSGTSTTTIAYIDTGESIGLEAGTYTFSIQEPLSVGMRIFFYNGGTNIGTATITAGSTYGNVTLSTNSTNYGVILLGLTENTQYNLTIKPQLEKGSKANSFTPYGQTPIELCKIGTYQDYIYKNNGSWYLHKEIGKVVLDGSENWGFTTNGNGWYIPNWSASNNAKVPANNATKSNSLCNYFINIARDDMYTLNCGCGIAGSGAINIKHPDYLTSTSNFTGWLSTYKPIFYYILATPTNTLIEDTTLIEQLEALQST